MRIAIIGRRENLLETAIKLHQNGHEIALIVTAKEAPEYTATTDDFKQLANDLRVPFIQTPKINKLLDTIRQLPPMDIGISANYINIITQPVVDCFRLGILNSHGGDLPRFRGNACQAWAILNGEERIGLCVHKMIGGELDSGDIITRDYYPLNINTKITDIYEWTYQRSQDLFLEAIDKLEADPGYVLESQSQKPADALRCYPRKPEDGRIDWNKPAIDVLRLINASNSPYAGAFCSLEGKKLIIWDAELVEVQENFLAVPGQVTMIGDGFVEIACATGKIRLLQVEIAGVVNSPDSWIKSIRQRLK